MERESEPKPAKRAKVEYDYDAQTRTLSADLDGKPLHFVIVGSEERAVRFLKRLVGAR